MYKKGLNELIRHFHMSNACILQGRSLLPGTQIKSNKGEKKMTEWKKDLENEILDIESLVDVLKLNEDEKKDLKRVSERHPLRITKYYMDLINFDDPNDPIKKLAIPSIYEQIESGSYDTSGEKDNTILTGLQHKYKETALVLSTNVCFMYCRHCFRKRMVGYTHKEISKTMKDSVEYIKNHEEITNVLVSGGDSFAMSNLEIDHYLKELTEINHLKFIRFGTRVPVVFPQRITTDPRLIQILKTYSKKKEMIVVTHFNHPNEITIQSIVAIKKLRESGCTIKNQTVLLKGINDHPKIISTLFKALISIGVAPYYLFQCRPVRRGTHFQVSLKEGIDIVSKARNDLDGIAKSFRYVMSHPFGKIEIVGQINDQFIFKFHQSKDEDHANMMFQRTINEASVWLDESLKLI